MPRLHESRRCHNYVEGLHFDRTSYVRTEGPDRACPNYVNMKKPRRVYWERKGAERVCWAYICDWCFEDLGENEEGWPVGDKGRFKESMECSLP